MGVLYVNKTLIVAVLLTSGVLSGCGTTTNTSQSTTKETTQTPENAVKEATSQIPKDTTTEKNNQGSTSNDVSDRSTSETTGSVEEINLVLQPGPCCPILSGSELEEIIEQLPGVTKATAGSDGQMTIWYDPIKTSQSKIEIQISQKTGYFTEIK
jgi:hypothetical protein